LSSTNRVGIHFGNAEFELQSFDLFVRDAETSATTPPTAVAPFDAAAAKAHQEAWAKYLGEPVVTTNSIGMQLAVIPPGKFMMGDGDNLVDVTLTRPFRLGVHEVAQGQWKEVMDGAEPWKGQRGVIEGDDVAASYVSWTDAVAFCRRLTDRERSAGRLQDGWKYRLPTE
ncbi:MAG: SUMF1/EgtB/PvdO family nonheme iron enzyme, partial [Planctomycetaceae bacterium]|nr:SUMF1/EgtB/PvdO family nonheme iron enzyme [Planctomycetaceae bacterium]